MEAGVLAGVRLGLVCLTAVIYLQGFLVGAHRIKQDYENHPCRRDCVGTVPRLCEYNFTVEHYHTLSMACYNCPFNATDCFRPHCVSADGVKRLIKVVNRMLPGPAIHVCEDDTLVVNVYNEMIDFEGTSIHWHGVLQRGTPHMDGVSLITQCPIPTHSSFQYKFKVETSGTHYWHAHSGLQRDDGVFGSLVVRSRKKTVAMELYDLDLPEHTIIVHDWLAESSSSRFALHHHAGGDNNPKSILINGRGTYASFNPDDQMDHSMHGMHMPGGSAMDHSMHGTDMNMSSSTLLHNSTMTTTTADPHDGHKMDTMATTTADPHAGHKMDTMTTTTADPHAGHKMDTMSTTTADPHAGHKMDTMTTTSSSTSTESQANAQTMSHDGHTMSHDRHTNDHMTLENGHKCTDRGITTPYSVFRVMSGKRFRFRFISNGVLNCPLHISIDGHRVTVIATDGNDVQPVQVNSFNIFAGERYDIVLTASQPVGNYWIRVRGLLDCVIGDNATTQTAILRYHGAPEVNPSTTENVLDDSMDKFHLNPLEKGEGLTLVSDLRSIDDDPEVMPSEEKPVKTYYLAMDYNPVENYRYVDPDFYPLSSMLSLHPGSHANHMFALQMNKITFMMPGSPPLSQYQDLDESVFCNETWPGRDCSHQFCECVHRLVVSQGDLVELVLVAEGHNGVGNHPMHLHGHRFWVVAMDKFEKPTTKEHVRHMDLRGDISRNLRQPPKKDTVMVPDAGYTIIRFKADNPGFWLFHCHVDFHMAMGMTMVLQVGQLSQMTPTPPGFPQCGSWYPSFTENAPQAICEGEVDTTLVNLSSRNVMSTFLIAGLIGLFHL